MLTTQQPQQIQQNNNDFHHDPFGTHPSHPQSHLHQPSHTNCHPGHCRWRTFGRDFHDLCQSQRFTRIGQKLGNLDCGYCRCWETNTPAWTKITIMERQCLRRLLKKEPHAMFVVGIGPRTCGSFELCRSRLFGHWHCGSQCSHGDDQGTAGRHHRTRPRSPFAIDGNRVSVVVVVMMIMIMSGKIRSFFGFKLLIQKKINYDYLYSICQRVQSNNIYFTYFIFIE
jgi:hypothetical protein